MFAARASTLARSLSRRGGARAPTATATASSANATKNAAGARRNMGGGGHWMEVSQPHYYLGEACGFFAWIWIFYRAKQDLGVVLGWRHPWEHAEDPWAIHYHVDNIEELEKDWEDFTEKATRPGDDDDDDDDEDDDDEEEDEDDDEDE